MKYFVEHKDVSIVASYIKLIDDNDNVLDKAYYPILYQKDTLILGRNFALKMLTHFNNFIGPSSAVLFKKSALSEKFGIYRNEQYENNQDFASWINLLKNGNIIYLPESLSFYRIHKDQESSANLAFLLEPTDWINIILNARKDGLLNNEEHFNACLKNMTFFIISALNKLSKTFSLNIEEYNSVIRLCEKIILFSSFIEEPIAIFLSKIASTFLHNKDLQSLNEFKKVWINELSKFFLINKSRPVFIWGTSFGGYKTLELMKENNININGFIDSDELNWGNRTENITVFPETILDNYSELNRPYVIIGSSSYAIEIGQSLVSHGYKYGDDYIDNIFLGIYYTYGNENIKLNMSDDKMRENAYHILSKSIK
jgi:hypothetical protein